MITYRYEINQPRIEDYCHSVHQFRCVHITIISKFRASQYGTCTALCFPANEAITGAQGEYLTSKEDSRRQKIEE